MYVILKDICIRIIHSVIQKKNCHNTNHNVEIRSTKLHYDAIGNKSNSVIFEKVCYRSSQSIPDQQFIQFIKNKTKNTVHPLQVTT